MPPKVTKQRAGYRPRTSPRKITKHQAGYGSNPAGFSCGVCGSFLHQGSDGCRIVAGTIRRRDCCNLFNSSTYRGA